MELEIYLDGVWHLCASIQREPGGKGGRGDPVKVVYDGNYARERLGQRGRCALSELIPVGLGGTSYANWPSFLIDLLPQGAARKRIEQNADGAMTEWDVLLNGAANPVGNLRVRRGVVIGERPIVGYDITQLTKRSDAFVHDAYSLGVTVAGATDTQGEAPKFWVARDANGVWYPDGGHVDYLAERFALLKFPTPEAGPRGSIILRHEAAYQRVAKAVGLRTTPVLPEYFEDALLIPRFDRRLVGGRVERMGVESIYSITGRIHSDHMTHAQVLVIMSRYVDNFPTEMAEYCARDVLNLAMGNRDNHGRNTAILKDTDGSIRLAPIFDLGPTYLDARAIVRSTRWPNEPAGEIDWQRALDDLETRFEDVGLESKFDKGLLAGRLREFGRRIRDLPNVMLECGVDKEIVEARAPEVETVCRSLEGLAPPKPVRLFGR